MSKSIREIESFIFKAFMEIKPLMIRVAVSKSDKRMFSASDIEILVDDIMINTIKSTQGKRGFNDIEHLNKYFMKSLNKRLRIAFFVRQNQMLKECKITERELVSQYKLAREIINGNRSIVQDT